MRYPHCPRCGHADLEHSTVPGKPAWCLTCGFNWTGTYGWDTAVAAELCTQAVDVRNHAQRANLAQALEWVAAGYDELGKRPLALPPKNA